VLDHIANHGRVAALGIQRARIDFGQVREHIGRALLFVLDQRIEVSNQRFVSVLVEIPSSHARF
jgi:hypothetical protein